MYNAICSECEAPCEVPFRPSGNKPVYCRKCFVKGGEIKGGPRNYDSYRDSRRESPKEPPRDYSKEQFEKLNNKLDKILKLLTPAISDSKKSQDQETDNTEKEETELVEAFKTKKFGKKRKE
jgi:CxxC-x17-CxxC domain-containing protein